MNTETWLVILKIIIIIATILSAYAIALLIAQLIWGSNLPEWLKVFLIAS